MPDCAAISKDKAVTEALVTAQGAVQAAEDRLIEWLWSLRRDQNADWDSAEEYSSAEWSGERWQVEQGLRDLRAVRTAQRHLP